MSQLVIDARTGRQLAHGNQVINAIAMASGSRFGGRVRQRADGTRSFISDNGRSISTRGFDQWRAHRDAKFIADMRRDAGLQGEAGGFPRDFEFIYQEVLDEPRRPLNWSKQFATDSRVPLGARTHTVRRTLGQGDAQIFRGGTDIPVVGGSRVEEQFRIIHIVSAVETDWFQMISDNFEGRNQFADDTRMAVRVIEERMNSIFFDGSPTDQVHGFLTYPGSAKTVSAEVYTASGSTPAAIVADLNRIANFPRQESGGMFQPNRMMTSIRVRDFLFNTRMDSGTDTTIGEFFVRNNEMISNIEGIQELEGAGPNGFDAIAAYSDGLESTAAVVVQPPTAMPAHSIDSFRDQVVYVATIGGIVQRNSGNNNISFVQAV